MNYKMLCTENVNNVPKNRFWSKTAMLFAMLHVTIMLQNMLSTSTLSELNTEYLF